VIGDPPVEVGADQDTVSESFDPAVAVKLAAAVAATAFGADGVVLAAVITPVAGVALDAPFPLAVVML